MQKLGYGEAKPLQIKIRKRNLPSYRGDAVILTDLLQIGAQLYPVLQRRGRQVAGGAIA
jgi:hypothetical protein